MAAGGRLQLAEQEDFPAPFAPMIPQQLPGMSFRPHAYTACPWKNTGSRR